MDLGVNPDVLIPRPETECLVEAVLEQLSTISDATPRRILDLGTGSGAIILALASRLQGVLFFASDRSLRAVRLAQSNARRHLPAGRIHFFCGDWMKALKSSSDLSKFFDRVHHDRLISPRRQLQITIDDNYKCSFLTEPPSGANAKDIFDFFVLCVMQILGSKLE